MKKIILLTPILLWVYTLQAQFLEFGVETVTGPAHTTFKGNLSEMVGFSELEIADFLENAGFGEIDMALVDREKDSPHFQTLMAIATKPT